MGKHRAKDQSLSAAIGQQIRQQRQRRALSQLAVATRSGVSREFISYCERGQRLPTVDTLSSFAQALECRLIDLLPPAPLRTQDELPFPDEWEMHVKKLNANERQILLDLARSLQTGQEFFPEWAEQS